MNDSRPRPLGVTLIALVYLVLAILALVIAARYVLNPAGDEELILLFDRLKISVAFLNLLAVPPLVTAGLATTMFRGLWLQKEWGRVAAIFFQFIGMLMMLALMAFLFVFSLASSRYMMIATGLFVLFTLAFIYLLKAVRQAPESIPAIAPPYEEPAEQVEALSYRPAAPAAAPPPPVAPVVPVPKPDLFDSVHHAATVVVSDKEDAMQAPAEPEPQPRACLTILSSPAEDRRIPLYARDYLIGRHPTLVDIRLDDLTVSARHARLRYENGEFVLYDLGSTNGTFVNGDPVQSRILRERKYIKMGETELLFTPEC